FVDLGDVFVDVVDAALKEVYQRDAAEFGMGRLALPRLAVALSEEFGVGVAKLLEERNGRLGAAPEVVQAALPLLLIHDDECGLVFCEDGTKADGAHQLGIGEVDK